MPIDRSRSTRGPCSPAITRGALAIGALAWAVTATGVAGAGSDDAPPTISTLVNERLGLTASTIVPLDAVAVPERPLRFDLELDGRPYTLDLQPHAVRGDRYRVYRVGADGVKHAIAPTPVNTFRGTVLGDPDSVVAASVMDDGIDGRVILSDGREFWFEPLRRHLDAHAGLTIVYAREDVLPNGGTCATPTPAGPRAGLIADGPARPLGTGVLVADLGCDADFEYFGRWGGGTADRVNAVINSMNIQYERDVEIRHVIAAILIRETRVYTSTDSFGLLSQFRGRWIQNHGDIERAVAHLFTGKNVDGSVIGRAWDIPGPICSDLGAYCFSQSDCCGGLVCATDLSAHELGHLWGAFHCDPCTTTMRSFIGCFNRFGPGSINSITNHRDSRTCLRTLVPDNDECQDAIAIGDGAVAFRTDNSTDEGPDLPETCDEGRGLLFRNDVWFAYTAACDGIATAEVCDATFDTRLAVYEDGDCPGVFVACNDNACGDGGTRSSVAFPVEEGVVYLVRIGARFAVGDGTLVVSCAPGLPCPEDLDASGAVDFGDILTILSAWGPCDGCPEDLDGSGAVDFGDILAVLSAWGPCP